MTIRALQYKYNGTLWSLSGEGYFNKGADIFLPKALEAIRKDYAFVDVDKIVAPKIESVSVMRNIDGETLTASATIWVGHGQKLSIGFVITEIEILQQMLTSIITE
jgi:hypothetical protein